MLELISNVGSTVYSTSELIILLFVAFGLGMLISLMYTKTHTEATVSKSFATTLVMLPPIVGAIIFLVGTNIASAFSLAGAFSIIRFRSAPGDAKDITFVLVAMAVGLACGMNLLFYAVIIAAFLSLVVTLLKHMNFMQEHSPQKKLKVVIPENLDYINAFESLFEKASIEHKLTKIKTIELGSLYELEYLVTLKDEVSDKQFIDDLRCRNGNLSITLQNAVFASEF